MLHEQCSPFLDEVGKPRLRNSVTAFLDILGFSALCGSVQGIDASQQMLDRIHAAMQDSLGFLRSDFTEDEAALFAETKASFFSDNLLFALACDDSTRLLESVMRTARCVQVYQLRMALNGFFIRGGITHGPICVTDQLIFGQALIDSYKLESKASIVPRVLLATDLFERISDRLPLGVRPPSEDWLCRDIDGLWFVNYLEAARTANGLDWELIREHKRSILREIQTSHHHHVLPKFGWLTRYHNMFCYWNRQDASCPGDARIDRVDEDSIIHRWNEILDDQNQVS